ncbi:MAG TPA: class I SAM-dependent methyltransferase [Jatrophihabitans sp.]|nr:class I SAM-dependent methyltransferase [Jatrophihabitans sp.]
MEYDPTQYLGAARYYLRGRPGYSADLATVLVDELGLDGTGHLVDVGSGPGTVGVQLARSFDRVTLVEPDPDMLAEARSHAAAAGLTSVDFVRATAEDLPDLGLRPARVVTFGQSFHRTDRLVVAEAVHRLLEPGGSLVLISHDPSRPAPPAPAGTARIPHEQIRELITKFLDSELRSGSRLVADYSVERFEQTLRRTSFGTTRTVFAPGRPDIVRDTDGVIAGCLSMSYAAPHLFGPRLDEFVAALRELLDRHSPTGRFWDWPGDTEILIATRR